MPVPIRSLALSLFLALGASALYAQSPQAAGPAVDRLFRISASLPPGSFAAGPSTEAVTFAIYENETGGDPIWQETQTLAVDAQGNYSVLLGATSVDGLPVNLFAGGAPRWLSVQAQGKGAARTLLTAVPYAVSAVTAANADNLGGRPASDYLLTPSARSAGGGLDATSAASAAEGLDRPQVNNGTANYIGKFFNNVDLINSSLYDAGGTVGLNTTTPLDVFHSRFTNAGGTQTGIAVQNLSGGANAYSGMLFYDQNGALGQFQGFNNSTHEYRINNIASGGSINFMLNSASLFRVTSAGTVADGGASNAGLTGTTASGAFRVAGLTGVNTHPSAQSLGLLGQATASPIGTGVNGIGSITGGYFEATGNPSGGFNPAGLYGVAGGTAGTGVVGQGSSRGVHAEGTGVFGVGLYAKAPALGYAIDTQGSIRQQRTDGGAVKAMAQIDQDGNVLRCFSSQSSGVSCGISVSVLDFTYLGDPAAQYSVDFNFQVADRFVSITPGQIDKYYDTFTAGNVATVRFTDSILSTGRKPFTIFVF